MKIWNSYMEYVRDNPNQLWFKRKIYGWGWTPVTWQGWILLIGYIACILLLVLNFNQDSSLLEIFLKTILPAVIFTVIFFFIIRKKGEKPRWQWGIPRSKIQTVSKLIKK